MQPRKHRLPAPPGALVSSCSSMSSPKNPLRQHSSIVLDGPDRAPNRSMLRAVGFNDADFAKPIVGIASTWSMVTPCNMHIDELAREAAAGADAAGGKSIIFGTITVSDGISMGTPGMRYSLVSREIIADSIETVAGAEGFDAVVAIGGCDKNMPGCVMAHGPPQPPGLFVYGGTILPGIHAGTKKTATSSPSSRRSASTQRRQARRRRSPRRSSAEPSRGRAPAAACTRPTPWPAPSRPWA